MATPVLMPRQGQSVESCIITKWNKNVGDTVNVGDVLFSYETDKAGFDEEAQTAGTFLAKFFEEGDDVECLKAVCVIGNPGEDFSEFDPNGGGAAADSAPAADAAPAVTEIKLETKPAYETKVSDCGAISPRARNLADKHGVDVSGAAGSGPNGRIIERDVRALIESGAMVTKAAKDEYLAGGAKLEGTGIGGRVSLSDLSAPAQASAAPAAAAAPEAKGEFEEVKIPNIRKVIAKSMTHSLSTMAQLTLNTSFDATQIMEYRKMIKANAEKLGLPNITLNDIVLFAVSRTILNHRDCNAHFLDDKIVYWNNCHLGIACDTERGLMVPTLFNSNKKSLAEIATESKSLTNAAKTGSINPDLLQGGTFTVTNLGSLGIESFTPVINPPQTAILGVDTIETKVKEVNGEYKFYPAMGLSLTFDHRALDGAPAAKFLKELVANLENFTVLLAK